MGQWARCTRAKEDQVLSYVRRAVTLAAASIVPALPLFVIVVGAKRW